MAKKFALVGLGLLVVASLVLSSLVSSPRSAEALSITDTPIAGKTTNEVITDPRVPSRSLDTGNGNALSSDPISANTAQAAIFHILWNASPGDLLSIVEASLNDGQYALGYKTYGSPLAYRYPTNGEMREMFTSWPLEQATFFRTDVAGQFVGVMLDAYVNSDVSNSGCGPVSEYSGWPVGPGMYLQDDSDPLGPQASFANSTPVTQTVEAVWQTAGGEQHTWTELSPYGYSMAVRGWTGVMTSTETLTGNLCATMKWDLSYLDSSQPTPTWQAPTITPTAADTPDPLATAGPSPTATAFPNPYLPQPFWAQINFNGWNQNYGTGALMTESDVAWNQPFSEFMWVPGGANGGVFGLQGTGRSIWDMYFLPTNRFMVRKGNEYSGFEQIVFDADTNIDPETSGCWPQGTATQNGPTFGVTYLVGWAQPSGYFANSTAMTQTVFFHDFASGVITVTEVAPGVGVSYPSWGGEFIVYREGGSLRCGSSLFDLSWANPSQPTPTPTNTPTVVLPTATPTASPTAILPTATPTAVLPTATPIVGLPTATPTVSPLPQQPPAAPTGLFATPWQGSLHLFWQDMASNEDGYRVYYSTNGSDWTTAAELLPNSGAFNLTGLACTTRYYVIVQAWNAVGSADASGQFMTGSGCPAPAPAPFNLYLPLVIK